MSGTATPRSAPLVATLVVLVVTGLVLAVGAWAASTGPDQVFAGNGLDPSRITTTDPSETPSEPPAGSGGASSSGKEEPKGESTLITILAVVLLGGLALLALAVVLAAAFNAWRTRQRYRRRRQGEEVVDITLVDPVTHAVQAMTADADRQYAVLRGGTPRNGIVACWQRFEAQAESAGVPRRHWETSTEFTLRLLALVDADVGAVSRLGELYRRARFSDHDVTEVDRATALGALETIHAHLATSAREVR